MRVTRCTWVRGFNTQVRSHKLLSRFEMTNSAGSCTTVSVGDYGYHSSYNSLGRLHAVGRRGKTEHIAYMAAAHTLPLHLPVLDIPRLVPATSAAYHVSRSRQRTTYGGAKMTDVKTQDVKVEDVYSHNIYAVN